jgi:alpha-tubulin suppressor-like RCC1 family protein
MLSRKLLGSGTTEPVERNFLFVWGGNTDLSEVDKRSTPFGFLSNDPYVPQGTSIFNGIPGTRIDGSSSPVLVSSQRIFKTLPDEVGQFGAVLDSGGQLHTFGNYALTPTISSSLALSRTRQNYYFTWRQIASNGNRTMAIRSDGALLVWGLNTGGILGINDGTTSSRSSPVQLGSESWTQVTCGSEHALAIRVDGTLWGWGRNIEGQLGTNSRKLISSPVQIGTSSWIQVDANLNSTAAIRLGGSLFTWGSNLNGMLGDNSVVFRSSPVQIAALDSWNQVSVGQSHMAAIRADGRLYTWGLNTSGQLGTGNVLPRSTPVLIGTSSWTQVATGNVHTIIIDSEQRLFATGNNDIGQLGTNDRINRSSPVQIGTNLWSEISTKHDHTLARTAPTEFGGALVFGWGSNSFNAVFPMGSPVTSTFSSPVQVTSEGQEVGSPGVTAGFATSFLRNFVLGTDNRSLFAWGANFDGQLGLDDRATTGTTIRAMSHSVINPTISRFSTKKWKKISATRSAAVAIDANGELWAWGRNTGQLGLPSFLIYTIPTKINSTIKWKDVAIGQSHTVLVREDGILYGMGSNEQWQLGLPSNTSFNALNIIDSNSWSQVSVKDNRSIGIKADGTLWGWGNNTPQFFETVFDPNPADVFSWSQISSSFDHTLAITSDGRLYTRGNNFFGQLGNGTRTNSTSFVFIPAGVGLSWNEVSAGRSFSTAIRSDNTLYAWGLNGFGQLGQVNTISRSSPVLVTNFSWKKVSCGFNHVLAIRDNDLLYTWGSGQFGKLGRGNLLNASSPTVLGTSSWTQISAGLDHSTAITTDNRLFTWGLGTSGQLGNGIVTTQASRSSPVQVTGGSASWNQVSAAFEHTLMLSSDNLLFATGNNNIGQLGTNDTTTRVSPVQIGTETYIDIRAQRLSSHGIRNDGILYGWGENTNRQLGGNDNINRSSPVQIGTKTWKVLPDNIADSLTFNAIDTEDRLFQWGSNTDPTQVNNILPGIFNPSPAKIGNSSWTQVSLGANAFYGIDANNKLYVGTSTQTQIDTENWKKVSTGLSHAVAIREDNTLWGVGRNISNVLGQSNTPRVYSAFSWKKVAAGDHTLAIRSDDTLWGWGFNNAGQLNRLTTTPFFSSPIQIGSAIPWKEVSIGSSFSTAISSDGNLYTWGLNNDGQLADGTRSNRSGISAIGGSWSQVSCGNAHVLAIRSDGLLFAWGLGVSGQLGGGNNSSRSSPVQIGTSSWIQVSAGRVHSAAIRLGGNLFTWGSNVYGQLGNNSSFNSTSPIQIGTSTWIQLGLINGLDSSYAIRTGGSLFSWGDNQFGLLGLGDQTTITSDGYGNVTVNSFDRSSPTQVGANTWTQTSGSRGVQTDGLLYTWGGGAFALSPSVFNGVFRHLDGSIGTPTIKFLNRNYIIINDSLDLGANSGVLMGQGTATPTYIDGFTTTSTNYSIVGTNRSEVVFVATSPVQIATGNTWTDVVAGDNFNYALRKS